MSSKTLTNLIIKKHGLTKKANFMFENEPYLEEVAHALVGFVTPHFIGEGLPLIDECIINSFESIDENQPFKKNIESFLKNLVEPAYLLIEKRISVETKTGSIAWVPMQESISQFLHRNESMNPVMVSGIDESVGIVSKKEASLMLAVHIMPAYAVSMTMECLCDEYKDNVHLILQKVTTQIELKDKNNE